MSLKPVELPCAVYDGDVLKVEASHSHYIELTATDMGQKATVCLTSEHARQLFNWLGVYLHTGGES